MKKRYVNTTIQIQKTYAPCVHYMIALPFNCKLLPPTSHSLIYSQDKVLLQEGYAAIFLCPHVFRLKRGVFRRGLLLLHSEFPTTNSNPDSGTCGSGISGEGMSAWAWVAYEYKGNLTNQTSENACYGSYKLMLSARASAGSTSVSASVSPSISGIEATSVGDFFQGDGDARVELEKFDYHSATCHHGSLLSQWTSGFHCLRCQLGSHCNAATKQKEVKDVSDAIVSISILSSSDTSTDTVSFGVSHTIGESTTVSVGGAVSTSQTVSDKTARVRSLELGLGDDGGWWYFPSGESVSAFFGNSVLEKQPKNASAKGKNFYTDTRETKETVATDEGHDTHRCTPIPCPTGECPPQM